MVVQDFIRSCLLRELTASQLVTIATRSDTGPHNRLDPIQSLVPPHYVCQRWIQGFFTRNTPTIFVPPCARRNFFKCAPLTWNPGSAPVCNGYMYSWWKYEQFDVQIFFKFGMTYNPLFGSWELLSSLHIRCPCLWTFLLTHWNWICMDIPAFFNWIFLQKSLPPQYT